MISVIIPVYNIVEYVCFCIESVIAQTCSDLEIIIIDDGSTDGSGAICDAYAAKDNRIQVIHQQNKGLVCARNIGLKRATGDYISFVDGDDYIHPQMMEVLLNALINSDPNVGFSMIYGEKIFQMKDPEPVHSIRHRSINKEELLDFLYSDSESDWQYHVVWNKLYKKTLIENLLFRQTAAEDTEFNNRIFQRTNKAILVDACLYYYIQRTGSLMHQPVNENYIDRLNSYDLCLEDLDISDQKHRGECLDRLFRVFLYTRHYTANTVLSNKALTNIRILKKKHIKEFLQNKSIRLHRKIILLGFSNLPFCYALFLQFMAWKSKGFH